MNEIVTTNVEESGRRSVSRMLFCVLVIFISLPFLAATVSVAFDFVIKPTSKLWQPRMLQSMLFNFGFWLGLCGMAVSITSRSEQRKTLGAATTLFGIANIVLGFALKRVFEQAMVQVYSLTPLIIPLVLWFLAILIAVRAPGRKEPEAGTVSDETEIIESEL